MLIFKTLFKVVQSLELTELDIFIAKPIFSSNHNIYFAKDIASLVELFGQLSQTYTGENDKFILQRAPPHYSTCIKQHYYLELQTFTYQTSLAKECFDKTIEPKFGLIIRSLE